MKFLKDCLKPFALLLTFTVFAMVATKNILYAKDEDKTEMSVPEVVVTAKKNKKSYKSGTVNASKYTEPLRDIPQTIAVIPQAVIQDQNATTLRETLRNVPGISMQAGEGGVPAGDNLSIRGFNARTDLFVDGFRDFGGYTRDPFNLEQVEVAKGPASTSAGRGSTGGSINQVSKMPELDAFYRGSVGFGSSFYKRTTLDINQPVKGIPIEGTAVRVNTMFHDGDVPNRDEVNYKRWGVAPSISFGLQTPLRATFSYFYMGQDNLPDYGIPWVPTANARGALADYAEKAAPVSWQNFYGLTERDYEHTHTNIFTGKIECDINDAVTLRDQFRYGHASRDSIITAPRFASTVNQLINRQVQARDMVDTILSNQTDATIKFETGSLGHTVLTGVEYARENSDNRPRTGPLTPLADLYNPEPGQSYDGPISINPLENEATSDSVVLYGFDTIELNEHFEINGGLRWDYFNLDFQPAGGDELSRVDSEFSWRGGIVYKPVEIGSFYFGYGTSFNPSAEGLTLSSTATATNNINTDPEKSRTFELGTKWDLFKEKLSANAAVFHTIKTNARTTDPGTNAGSTADDVVVLQGEQRVRGMEFGLAGSIVDPWKVYAAYTVLESKVLETLVPSEFHHELPNTPDQSFNIWTTYRLPGFLKKFEIGYGMQYVGSRFNNVSNLRKAAGYWLFDGLVSYEINEHITLRLNAYNLTDQEFIESLGGGHFIPGAGRQIVASTDFEF